MSADALALFDVAPEEVEPQHVGRCLAGHPTRRGDVDVRAERAAAAVVTCRHPSGCREPVELAAVRGTVTGARCNATCTGATGPVCDCACGGRNHGATWST